MFDWIEVDCADLSKLRPPYRNDAVRVVEQVKIKGTPGRKPTCNRDGFYTELVAIADLDELPPKQADCERTMAHWGLEHWGKEPGRTMLQGKIARIYKRPRKTGEAGKS